MFFENNLQKETCNSGCFYYLLFIYFYPGNNIEIDMSIVLKRKKKYL